MNENYLVTLHEKLFCELLELCFKVITPADIVQVFSAWLSDNGLAIVNDDAEIVEI
jgi:hypothetical protein